MRAAYNVTSSFALLLKTQISLQLPSFSLRNETLSVKRRNFKVTAKHASTVIDASINESLGLTFSYTNPPIIDAGMLKADQAMLKAAYIRPLLSFGTRSASIEEYVAS